MVVINDTFENRGGSQTLMLRMCQWIVSNGDEAVFLYNKDDNRIIVDEIIKAGGRVVDVGGDRLRNLCDFFCAIECDELCVISFSWNYYIELEIVKRELGIQFNNVVYCIIPDTFEKGNGISNRLVRSFLNRPYRAMLKKADRNKAIIMMDEVCKERTERWNGFELDNSTPIIRLPITFPLNDGYTEDIELGFDSDTILTVSRADFPFKGYLIGLIDSFVSLKKSFASAKLTIIADGADVEGLKRKVESVPRHFRDDIELIGWLPYDEVVEYVRRCKVFIGMSSILLDAAKYYRVCIPVRGYTKDCLAKSFFDSDPRYLYAADDCNEPALSLLEECMSWDFDYYKERSVSHYYAVKQLYDIDDNMHRLLEVETIDQKCVLSAGDALIHKAYLKMVGR